MEDTKLSKPCDEKLVAGISFVERGKSDILSDTSTFIEHMTSKFEKFL